MKWIDLIANLIIIGWLIPGAARNWMGRWPDRFGNVLRTLFWELRPLFLVAVVAHAGAAVFGGDFDWWSAFGLACNIFNWFAFKDPKDDDDDRWKRRKEKLAEKVSVLSGRLVVAPVSAS